jgi:gliding motility-associated-like protein
MNKNYFVKTQLKKSLFSFSKRILVSIIALVGIVPTTNAQWSSLGVGANDIVYSVSPDVAGTGVYFGESFANAGGKNYIRHWNGAAVSNLNASAYVNGYIYAIAVSGNNIYVGGDFTKANNVAGFNGIACWNTTSNTWSTLGTGVAGSNKTVYSLTVDAANNLLYVGGEFTSVNGTGANNIASYGLGTSTWAALGSGATGAAVGNSPPGAVAGVYALTKCGSKLYAGGRFTTMNGAAANSVAAWDGATWSTLSGGGQIGVGTTTIVNPANVASAVWDAPVMALTNDGTTVYVGGDFNKVNNATGCNNIAAWNTGSSTWSTMGAGLTWPGSGSTATDNTFGDQANVYALTMYNGNVIAGGDFMKAGTVGGANTSLFVASWNGSAWSALSTNCGGATESDVFALTVSNGLLYAGGQFPEDVPNTPANMWYIADYTGAGPTISIAVAPTNTICAGGSTTITASGAASSYAWSPTTALSCTNCASPTASPTVTTTYTITGTLGGCTSKQTITVVVNPKPTLTLTPTSSSLCGSASSTTITASGASTYTWTSAATLSASTGTIVTATPTTTTIYTVNATSAAGCTNNKTVTITINPIPTLTLTATSPTICLGSNTTITASGASTYTWSPAGSLSASTGTSVTATPTTTTTIYTVNATSAAGCTATQTVSVTVNPLPTLTLTSSSATVCAGTTSTLTASGASTYTWTPASTLSSANGTPVIATPTATTNYTVNGTDVNGCKNKQTITVNMNPLPSLTLTTSSATVCTGNSSTLTATGASTYTWTSAATLSSANGTPVVATPTASTTYTVNATDVNGCVNNKTVTVNISTPPTLTLTAGSTTICATTSTNITASGASTYTWSPSGSLSASTGTSVTATPTTTTIYTVTGTNAAGCIGSQTITINVNTLPTLTVSPTSATVCAGTSSTLTATGANTYTWSPAASLSSSNGTPVTATPTTTTIYTVTGTDGNGCTNSNTSTITVNPLPNINISGNPSVICSGVSSTITATGADTYTWSPAGSLNTSTGPLVIATPTTSTIYTVVGTFTASGCVNTSTINLAISATPSLTIGPSSTFTICLGDSTSMTVTGGTTYTWTPAGSLNSSTSATVTATPTTTTIYTVSGIAGGCTSSASTATVTVNFPPDVSAHATSHTICVGATTTISATGNAVTYTWSPAASLDTPFGTPVVASPTTTTNYTVIGTGANGCTATDSVKITVNPTPTISISSSGGGNTQIVCSGTTVNAITFNVNPGVAPIWNNTNINIGIIATDTGNIASYTAPTLTTTQTGVITAIAIDSTTGCSSSATNPPSFTVTINPLPIISATDSLTPGGCGGLANGCISNVAGQVPGTYQYSWDNGATWSNNSQNCNIPAGNYPVEVKDANGCIAQKTISLPTANAPALPNVAGLPSSTCAGDTINLSITSAIQPHMTFTWTTSAGTQTGTTYTINNTNPAGTYSVGLAIADSNSCSNSTSYTFTVNAPPQPIISGANHFCKGTSATLHVNPTGANYTYQWNNTGVAIAGATASSYTATSGGIFGVAVTNTLTGCKHDTTITITVDSVPAAPSIITPTNNNTYCQGVTINPISVTGTGTFTWYSDAGLTTPIGTGSPFTPTITTTGTVTIYVTASSSVCTGDSTPVLIIINPTPATPTITIGAGSQGYCANINPLPAIVAGGPSTIVWYDDAGLTHTIATGTTYTPSGLAPGTTTTYYLVDSSSAGCKSVGTATASVIIYPNPATPLVVGPTTYSYCEGINPGTITASGASTIVWYDDATLTHVVDTGTTYTPTGLSPNTTTTYYLVDSSAQGCKSVTNATVSVTINALPSTPTITTGNTNIYCEGSAISPINVAGSGTIVWYNNAALTPPAVATGNTYTPSGLSPNTTTTYYLTDTSAAGCKSSGIATVSITINPKPVITGNATVDSSLCGKNNGAVLGLTVNNGTQNYMYQWVDASGATVGISPDLTNVGAGTYSLIVIDANNCRDTSNGSGYTVGVSNAVTADFTPSTYQGTAPLAVTFSNTSTGANAYGWSFGTNTTTSTQANPSYTYTNGGTYIVTLVASNGNCTDTARKTIIIDVAEVLIIPNIFSPNGDGINDQFFITSSGISTLNCDIYNRWGQLIFSIKSVNQTWDGVMNNGNHASEGTYFYLLQATGFDGKEYKKDGPLTLVR